MLAEIATIAAEEQVDLVLVTGDLFESAAPPPDAQRVVWDALLALRATGARGHRDRRQPRQPVRARRLVPGVRRGRHHAARPRDADPSSVASSSSPPKPASACASSCCRSSRSATRSAPSSCSSSTRPRPRALYAERMRLLIAALSAGFRADTVNLLAAHCFVRGGTLGGGERDAQTIFDYSVEGRHFPQARELHRARPPPPHPAHGRARAGLVRGVADPGRLRRGAGREARAARRRRGGRAGPRSRTARADDARGRCARVRGTLAELKRPGAERRRRVAARRRARADACRPRRRRARDVPARRRRAGRSRRPDAPDVRAAPCRAAVASPHELFAEYLERSRASTTRASCGSSTGCTTTPSPRRRSDAARSRLHVEGLRRLPRARRHRLRRRRLLRARRPDRRRASRPSSTRSASRSTAACPATATSA